MFVCVCTQMHTSRPLIRQVWVQEFPSVHQIRQKKLNKKKTATKCVAGCLAARRTDFVFAEPSRLCFPSGRPVVVVHRGGGGVGGREFCLGASRS